VKAASVVITRWAARALQFAPFASELQRRFVRFRATVRKVNLSHASCTGERARKLQLRQIVECRARGHEHLRLSGQERWRFSFGA